MISDAMFPLSAQIAAEDMIAAKNRRPVRP
jgi:hypothetical protein